LASPSAEKFKTAVPKVHASCPSHIFSTCLLRRAHPYAVVLITISNDVEDVS
jgi:hypothetical protein